MRGTPQRARLSRFRRDRNHRPSLATDRAGCQDRVGGASGAHAVAGLVGVADVARAEAAHVGGIGDDRAGTVCDAASSLAARPAVVRRTVATGLDAAPSVDAEPARALQVIRAPCADRLRGVQYLHVVVDVEGGATRHEHSAIGQEVGRMGQAVDG